jgi:hypothetical protein
MLRFMMARATPHATATASEVALRISLLPGLLVYGLLTTPSEDGGALPCLWRLWFGITCPGCGLSRANALLVHGSIGEAVAMNWLIIPVWLVAVQSLVVTLSTFNAEAHHG